MAEDEKKEEVESVIVNNAQEKKRNLIRIVVVGFLIILFVVLIGIRINNPDLIKTSTLVIVMGVTLIIGVFAFFSFEIFQKFENLKKKVALGDDIPPASSEEEVLKRLHEHITNDKYNGFQNHIVDYYSTTQNINQNTIYIFKIELLYEDKRVGRHPYVLINANYMSIIPAVLPQNIKKYDLQQAINNFSSKPYSSPDTEETVVENPITMTRAVTKRTSHKKKDYTEQKDTRRDIG